MAQPNFDYQGALDAGYSDAEIGDFLRQMPSIKQSSQAPQAFQSSKLLQQENFLPGVEKQQQQRISSLDNQNLPKHVQNFDFKGAQASGYSPEEINEFLSNYKPERSTLEKAGRLGAQVALGAGEMAMLPYEMLVAPLAIPGGREALGDLFTRDILSEVYPTEAEGKFVGQRELAEPINLGIRGLAEKVTGLDLHPEGVLEKAASWMGFIKNPKNIKNLHSIGITPKTLTKALFPAPSEAIRGLSAGAALEMAEEGQFGPVGTLAAAVTGDLLGMGAAGTLKAITQPTKTLAKTTSLFTGANAKKELIKDIISDAEKAGITLDAGTLTGSPVVQFAQARLAQSSLSGKSLDNFRKNLSGQIVKQYETVVNDLGDLAFENNHQAAESIRNFVKQEEKQLFREPYTKEELRGAKPLSGRIATEERPNIQQEFLSRIAPEEFRNSYEAGETLKTAAEDIKAPLKQELNRRWDNLNKAVEEIPLGPQGELSRIIESFIEEQRGSLLLGESAAENKVLQSAIRLRNALGTEEGALLGVTLRDLIKTKRTLGDVANWEFGGSNFQSAYKHLVGEIDRAVERTLERTNPQLRRAYEQLNAEYSMFKDVFENKNVMPLFEPKNENFNTIYNGFLRNPDKLRSLEDMLFANPRGQQLINQVKRDYAQRVVESPGLSSRDLRNLENVLGPQSQGPIQEFMTARLREIEQPLPRAARQPTLGAKVVIPETRGGKPLAGRGSPKAEHARRKLFEHIKGKTSDQIMKQMDTPEGIQKLRKALSLTAEGDELFKKLARYKLSEMIDRNLMDNLGENVKLGKFSGLFTSGKSEAVVKELVGNDAFTQLRLLQKNAARLQASAEKFYNASKSGTTLLDASLASTAIVGIFSGNPYLALPAIGKIGGMWVGARLLANEKFLGYLKEAALTDNKEKFLEIMKKMKPEVERAVITATMEAREEK